MAQGDAATDCPQCGAAMDQDRSWRRKSVPIIGSKMEYANYTCPECGHGAQLKRKLDTEEWHRA